MNFAPYSYRDDPKVPDFDDSRSLFIFDHHCVLCTGGVGFIMKHDKSGRIAFTSAQKPLGEALCEHYGIDWDESYLFIHKGRPYIKSAGYFAVAAAMGGIWHLPRVFQIIPRVILDPLYDLVARNRYKWFGQTQEACAVLTPDQRARLIEVEQACREPTGEGSFAAMISRPSIAVLAFSLAALSGCSGKAAEEPFAEPQKEEEAAPAITGADDLLGGWRYSHQTCYEDADPGIAPNPKPIDAWLSLLPDGTYEFSVEGFPFSGTFEIEPFMGDKRRIVLDTGLHFVPEGETLANWGEGEATYVCANVFIRGGP